MASAVLLVSVPSLPPFVCGYCGNSEGGPDFFVDTGIDIEVPSFADGRLYICDSCFSNMVDKVPNTYTKGDMDMLVETQQDLQKYAQSIINNWEQRVSMFKTIGIDLDKAWENLNGNSTRVEQQSDSTEGPGDSEPVSDHSESDGSNQQVVGSNLHLNPLLSPLI